MHVQYFKANETRHLNIKTSPFETLYRLEGYLTAQLAVFRYATIKILALALSSPAWFGIAVVFGISGQGQLATFFMLLVPSSIALAFMLWLCLYFVIFPYEEAKRQLLARIKQELQCRGRQSFSFANDN
jgi:hypothetical protein